MAIFARDPLNNFLQDYVVSGCVWTGDALGSTRAASMASGTVCIAGNFYVIAAATARSFTASKDTYIDVDSTGTIVYTEVANNAASPALATGSIRIGIIVTGTTTIATAGSINQGQVTSVLPIASSIAYATTDSLGNLIYPRDPNRKLLGYRQIIASQTGITTLTDITGLNTTIIVPTGGARVKVTGFATVTNATTAGSTQFLIDRGGQVQTTNTIVSTSSFNMLAILICFETLAAGTYTYKLRAACAAGTTSSILAGSTQTAFISVEQC